MKRKVLTKIGFVLASLLWLTPSYVCAKDLVSRSFSLVHVQQDKDVCPSCCPHQSTSDSDAPCRATSACGIEQQALDSHVLGFALSPVRAVVFNLFVPVDPSLGVRRLVRLDFFRSPPINRFSEDFFSTSSNLSPPSLS